MSFLNNVASALNGEKESRLVSEITLHIKIRGTEIECEPTVKRGSAKCQNQDDAQKVFDHFERLDAIERCLVRVKNRVTSPEKQPLDVLFSNQPEGEEPNQTEVKTKK